MNQHCHSGNTSLSPETNSMTDHAHDYTSTGREEGGRGRKRRREEETGREEEREREADMVEER